jgi:hypothetical protein
MHGLKMQDGVALVGVSFIRSIQTWTLTLAHRPSPRHQKWIKLQISTEAVTIQTSTHPSMHLFTKWNPGTRECLPIMMIKMFASIMMIKKFE